jgi:copper resistance protein B
MISEMLPRILFVVLVFAATCLFISADASAEMEDDPILFMSLVDQFETRDVGDNSFSWDAQAWFGKDLNKLWIKTDGDREGGVTEDAELQFLYSRSIARYWEFQVGARQDFQPSPSRSWAVVGIQGLAPYFFETDIAFFIGESGRTALRFESEYELLFTQRLILTPDIEVNFYGQDDAAVGIGSGLSDLELGLRLRYEIRREFAPYVGFTWTQLFGGTKDFVRLEGQEASDVQFVIGLRAWF